MRGIVEVMLATDEILVRTHPHDVAHDWQLGWPGQHPLWFLFLGVGENRGGRAAANPFPANTAHNQRTRHGPWGGNIEESEMRV